MLILYIISQLLFYALIMYVFYRFVYRSMLANRDAAIGKDEPTDYAPESVNAAFIDRVSGNRDRSLHTQRELALADILVRWNPGEVVQPEVATYDESVPAVLALFDTQTSEDAREAGLTQIFEDRYHVTAQNVPGMVNYLNNWHAGVAKS